MSEIKKLHNEVINGEEICRAITTDVLNKLICFYEKLEPNQKSVCLDLVSSDTKDILKKISFSRGL